MFEKWLRDIDAAYQRLGYQEGWRFLYGPRRTLAAGTRVVFLGLNPGGSGAAARANQTFVKPEVPEGNAYRVEPGWNTRHQDEVKTLFLRLVEAARIPKSWQRFMDEDVLTSNFCPFRSASWKDLPRKREAVEFSGRLWSEVLGFVRPRLIVCNGSETFDHVQAVLDGLHGKGVKVWELASGWGVQRHRFAVYGEGMVVGVPHLSRFRVFSAGRCALQTAAMVREMAGQLSR